MTPKPAYFVKTTRSPICGRRASGSDTTRDLATCFARAVLDRIETDRCCNSDNIGDAIFREMAVAGIGGSEPSSDVRRATVELVTLMQKVPHVLFGAPTELYNALMLLMMAVEKELPK